MPSENLSGPLFIRPVDPDLDIKPAGAHDGGIDEFFAVGSANDNHIGQALNSIEFREQLGNNRGFHIGGHTRATSAEDRFHLIEEDDHWPVSAELGQFAGPLKDEADAAFRLPHILIEQLWALDVEEVARALAA